MTTAVFMTIYVQHLQTGIVTFAGQPTWPDGSRRGQNATSVVVFRSEDGVYWDYLSTIAAAKDYPASWEGPNEMDLASLDDGSLLAVLRMDGGDSDGEKWAPHHNLTRDFDHFLPYHISRSTDGVHWSPLLPLPAGCARPRLLNVHGTGTLLLSGGRFHAAQPQTSDALLWASKDQGRTWEEFSLSYHHNKGVGYNATLTVDAQVNDTHWPIGGVHRFTSAYTSLVRVGPRQVLVTYNFHTALNGFPVEDPRSSSVFGMVLTLADAAAAPVATLATAAAAPVVYWKSNPVRPNETVLIAGAGLNGATTEWCHSSGACDPASATVGESSVQAVLPRNCTAPCALRMATDHGTVSVDVNGPEVTWARVVGHGDGSGANMSRLLRVFGRGLAWETDGVTCVSAAQPHTLGSSTILSLAGVSLTTYGDASCYEASFVLPASIPGGSNEVKASLSTPWGTATFDVSIPPVARVPKPPAIIIDVDAEYAGNVSAAVAAAAAVVAPQRAVIKLGAKTYSLTASLTVPNRTDVVGAGDRLSILDFSLPDDMTPLPVSTSDSLYAATRAFAVGGGASDWSLRNLSVELRRGPPRSAAVWLDGCGRHGSGAGSRLRLLGVTVRLLQDNVSNNAVVIEGCAAPDGTGGGTDFEIGWSTFVQEGACWVLDKKHKQSFNHSWGGNAKSVLTTVSASGGWLHDNVVQWNCGGSVSFVRSDRTIVENNLFNCTGGTPTNNDTSVIEGANDVNSWHFPSRPCSKLWSITRNKFVRPAHNDQVDPTHQNWYQRETLTSDAPGEYGHGMLIAVDGVRVRVAWNVTIYDRHVNISAGATLTVLGGGGLGQRRLVAGYDRTTDEVILETPLDAHAVPLLSYVAVIPSDHDYVIAGNTFAWGNVVQLFGNSYRGILADNRLENCNHKLMNQASTNTWDLGAMRAKGLHYHGASPVFFTEIVGNTLVNSDGIVLGNQKPPRAPGQVCSGYNEKCVAYLRWAVVRRNVISGVSAAALNLSATHPPCGYVSTNGPRQPFATYVVAEHNTFRCPRPGFLPYNGTHLSFCSNCTAR